MKTTWVGIAAVLLAASTLAIGQDYYWGGPYYDYRASTPAESAARGMADIARETGLGRESLYKALPPEGNPEFGTVLKVVKALGLRLRATIRG